MVTQVPGLGPLHDGCLGCAPGGRPRTFGLGPPPVCTLCSSCCEGARYQGSPLGCAQGPGGALPFPSLLFSGPLAEAAAGRCKKSIFPKPDITPIIIGNKLSPIFYAF